MRNVGQNAGQTALLRFCRAGIPRIKEAKRIYKREKSRMDVISRQVSGMERRGSIKMHEVLDTLCRTRLYVLMATGTCRPGLLASVPRLPLKQGMISKK
jgi:hypothetical protein